MMLNLIQTRFLAIPDKQTETPKLPTPAPQSEKARPGFRGAQGTSARSLDNLGLVLLKEQHGEAFAKYYQNAMAAAEQISGGDFLQQYRALKRNAQQQGMSDHEFKGFERCLYRTFYKAAVRDNVEKSRNGRPPSVKPHELAYIAKVAEISEFQLKKDTLAQERSHYISRMKTIVAQGGHASTRSKDS